MYSPDTLAETIVCALAARGVRRMFGIPGGGSSLDLIDAAGARGIEFVLTRTETAAVIMASVTGELTGTPGVALVGVGPGAASSVNGVAYACLERAPLLLFTDGPASSLHQAFDQNALFAPITKDQGRLRPADGRGGIESAIEIALAPPMGPVQMNLTAADAAASITDSASSTDCRVSDAGRIDRSAAESARELLKASRRPVIIVGLEARYGDAPAALLKLADALSCPVLLTYKAKGVLPDTHPGNVGMFTGALAEAEIVGNADLIILFGLDPVELIPGTWPYDAPILDLFPYDHFDCPSPPAGRLIGSLADAATAVRDVIEASDWTQNEVGDHRDRLRARLRCAGDGHTSWSVVEQTRQAAPVDCRATVDAGAHMFSAFSAWVAREPFGILKSNGLSTMGYALPAAIASSLAEPERSVVAFTGDGGLLMCLGELKTAVENDCRIVVVVLNDSALSLIDIKQQRQRRQSRGVKYAPADFAGIAQALGCRAWQVGATDDLASVLAAALGVGGPALIDVTIDPAGYPDQLVALRG